MATSWVRPFQRVVLALDRDQHGVGAGEGVHGQQPERRRAVDEDPVPGVALRGDARARAGARARLDAASSTSAPASAIDEGTTRRPSTGDRDVERREWAVVDERVVDRSVEGRAIDPEAARRVALGIEVDDEDAITGESQIGCEIDHRGGLPDAALLIGAGDRLAHSTSAPKHDHHVRILPSTALPPGSADPPEGPRWMIAGAAYVALNADMFHVKRRPFGEPKRARGWPPAAPALVARIAGNLGPSSRLTPMLHVKRRRPTRSGLTMSAQPRGAPTVLPVRGPLPWGRS